ncbi:hypothetical protein HY493_04700 [Candidatus Woesearchaeota archaeon]|nr:hypothetical protein [Candidatus Woesearchaeota archaeon]
MIDLQVHTSASDGNWTLENVLRAALKERICAIAITDHDCVDAWKPSTIFPTIKRLAPVDRFETFDDHYIINDLQVIHAEEITCAYRGFEIHLLGYFLCGSMYKDSELEMHNRAMIEATKRRAQSMISKLQQAGYLLEWNDVVRPELPQMIRREFIADKLLERNRARITAELKAKAITSNVSPRLVSDNLIGRDSPFYASVPEQYLAIRGRHPPELKDAVEMVMYCGGVPVISHPGRYKFLASSPLADMPLTGETSKVSLSTPAGKIDREQLVRDFKQASRGLGGLEVHNRKHVLQQIPIWRDLARRYELLVTAGTDFHGERDDYLGALVENGPAGIEMVEKLALAADHIRRIVR